MRFGLSEVERFAVGVDRVEALADGWRFHRLPPDMEALYEPNPGTRIRAHCTAGVRLRFVSDTRWIRVAMRYGPPARWYFTGALAIDDARVDAFGPISLQSTWSGVIFNQAEPQLHTHDIWLPHCCGAELLALEVEDGDSLRSAPPFALTWLAYGDSITQGMVGTQPVLTWTSRVARSLNAKLTNVGVGGATLRAELALTVADTPAGLITVSYGGNDWNQDIRASRYGENAQALIAALRRQHPRTPIVLTSPLPFFRRPARNGKGETHTVFRKALESAARGHEQVHVLDGYALLPADEAYYHDGIHPNDPGMTHLAETILDTLQHLGVVPD